MIPDKALEAIAAQQLPDGSFAIIASEDETVPYAARLMLHAFLLQALRGPDDRAGLIVRLVRFIVDEIHIERLARESTTIDVSAIFYALATVYNYDDSLIPPEMLATSVRFLVVHEIAPGGPYAHKPGAEPDVDANISISYFVHCLGGPFPALLAYIAKNQDAAPRQFTESWPRQWMLAEIQGATHNAANATLEAPTFFRYTDPRGSSSRFDMPVLSAAFALRRKASPARIVRSAHDAAYRRILARAQQASPKRSLVAVDINHLLARTAAGDKSKEIGLLALRLAPSLQLSPKAKRALETLGAANLYNWVAYTTYDNFLDGEGRPGQLPLANVALRTAIRLFDTAVPNKSFNDVVTQAFDTVDGANAWELAHCRFNVQGNSIEVEQLPDYGDLQNLYECSVTHSLPMLGAFTLAGIAPNSQQARQALEAFKHYLTIRQLNDDLHDWQDDLRAGHISYVVARLLSDAKTPAGVQPLASLITSMEQTFLRQTLPAIGADMLARAAHAHQLLRNIKRLDNPNVIDTLIDGHEQTVRQMFVEHRRAAALMEAFKA